MNEPYIFFLPDILFHKGFSDKQVDGNIGSFTLL